MEVGAFCLFSFYGFYSDRMVKLERGTRVTKPEYRLLPMIPAAFFILAKSFWYGWGAQKKAPWTVTILGTAVIGCEFLSMDFIFQTYLFDEFGLYVASTTAATTSLRSLTGALISLAGDKGMGLWDTDGDTRYWR